MRFSSSVPLAALAVSLLVCVPSGSASAAAPAAAAAADMPTALYEMNQDPGASVMLDSSGNGHNGAIDPTGVQTGYQVDGAIGYNWTPRSPTAMPPSPERVIQVPDNGALEPGDQDFTVEIRYRTSHPYGNLVQKGQALATGGQWKIQLPGGRPSCLFQGGIPANPIAGEDYQITARTPDPIDDNQWHVLRCEFTFIETAGAPTSRVNMFVDGEFKSRKNGLTGTIDNRAALTMGGKLNCGPDHTPPGQPTVTCDYFTGQVDYLKLFKTGAPGNEKPDAVMPPPTCDELSCSFSSAGSNDPDGDIDSYAWTFGDGSTSASANPSHTYARDGSYKVVLTVTDDEGATGKATRTINVASGDAPTKPRKPTAAPGDRSAVVSWLKPGNPGSNPVSGYRVTSSPGGKTCATTTALSCRVSGLTNEQPYTFTVVATSPAGTSPASVPTTAVTPIGKPLAPATVKAAPGNARVTVSWTAANGNGMPVTSYRITKSTGGPAKIVPATDRSVVIGGLRNGTSYRFSVVATNAHGVGAARTSPSVTPAGPPRQPTRVTALARPKAAAVSWRAPAPSGARVTSYVVMCTGGKTMAVGGKEQHVRFTGLKSGKKYAFKVRAINKLGRGAWSSWSSSVKVR